MTLLEVRNKSDNKDIFMSSAEMGNHLPTHRHCLDIWSNVFSARAILMESGK